MHAIAADSHPSPDLASVSGTSQTQTGRVLTHAATSKKTDKKNYTPSPVDLDTQFERHVEPTGSIPVNPTPHIRQEEVSASASVLPDTMKLKDAYLVHEPREELRTQSAKQNALTPTPETPFAQAPLDDDFFDAPIEPDFEAKHIYIDDAYSDESPNRSVLVPVLFILMILLGGGVFALVKSDLGRDEVEEHNRAKTKTEDVTSHHTTTSTPTPTPTKKFKEPAATPTDAATPAKKTKLHEEKPEPLNKSDTNKSKNQILKKTPSKETKPLRKTSRKKKRRKPSISKRNPKTKGPKIESIGFPPKKVGTETKVNTRLKKNLDWLKKRK